MTPAKHDDPDDPDDPLSERFGAMMGVLDGPLVIVTTISRRGERAGCLVGFTTQASMDPPRFLVLLSRRNHTFGVARDADLLAVHLVPGARHDLAEQFGSETGDRIDKFATVGWSEGPGGVPLVEGCPHWFVGRILNQRAYGYQDCDHVPFLLEPIEVSDPGSLGEELLRLSGVTDLEPGHEA
jgi:flavin reductase (DIM6/NTAB) family NADH-FMN oxidoreductase RutF